MLILWIDPGVRKCGYALVDFSTKWHQIIDSGILFDDTKTDTRDVRFIKMTAIYTFFMELTKHNQIDKICIERLYFTSRNQANAEFVYGIRWALIVLFQSLWVTIQEIDPVQVKKYISWNGKATKDLVQKKIMQLYWLSKKPQYNDSADALGMARLGNVIK